MMDRASFDLLSRPEILVGMSCQAASVAPDTSVNVQPDDICLPLFGWTRFQIGSIVLIVGHPSDGGLRKIDGASRGVDFLRLFPRLGAGQDALRENPNSFKSISVVIPIAIANVLSPIQGRFNCARLFLLLVAHHAINLAKEFEHDVHRISAPRTQIEIGAGSRE
jgi:hypothetical protein